MPFLAHPESAFINGENLTVDGYVVTTATTLRCSPRKQFRNAATLRSLVKHLASLLGSRGIRVNAVTPRIIETDISNVTKTDAGRNLALNIQSLKRIGKSDDVADATAFLTPTRCSVDHRGKYSGEWWVEVVAIYIPEAYIPVCLKVS